MRRVVSQQRKKRQAQTMVSQEWGNCYEVDEKTYGVDSRDKVKHNERSDQLLLAKMFLAELGRQEVKSECCQDVEPRWRYVDMENGRLWGLRK